MINKQQEPNEHNEIIPILIGGVLFPLAVGVVFAYIAVSTAWDNSASIGIGVLIGILIAPFIAAYIIIKQKAFSDKIDGFIKHWGLPIGVLMIGIAIAIAINAI